MDGFEAIERDGTTYAYLLRASVTSDRTSFLTPDSLNMQLGFVVYKAGTGPAAHLHRPIERRITGTLELILVRSGLCDIDVYDDARQLVGSRTMSPGDAVLLVAGGHGFRMREDTVLLEVKQGPYTGIDEKVRFDDPRQ
jgi:hypothetical protein